MQLFIFVKGPIASFTFVKYALQTPVGHFCGVSKMVSRGTIIKKVAYTTISYTFGNYICEWGLCSLICFCTLYPPALAGA